MLLTIFQDHGDVREIHEEYDEEAEKEWRGEVCFLSILKCTDFCGLLTSV